jgi:antitoxin ParD1/3/4
MSNTGTITIDLGEFGPRVRQRIDSGEYSSPTEVIQAGLEALEREEADFDRYLREKVEESLSDSRPDIPAGGVLERLERRYDDLLRKGINEAYEDPRPSIPADEVFARLRARHHERMKARGLET